MVWEPFAIAVVFGLVVSAGLYFIVMWPQVEPDDELAAASEASSAEPVTADAPAAVDTAARTSDAPTTDAADVKATTSASLSSEHDDGGDPPAA